MDIRDNVNIRSYSEHIEVGLLAIKKLNAIDAYNVNAIDAYNESPQPVCHHFSEINPIDIMKTSMSDTYKHLSNIMPYQIDFLSDRLEAWETVIPTKDWLKERIRIFVTETIVPELIYEGWSWESNKNGIISTTNFDIIDNHKVENI